jgi:hypothetical protein
VVAGPFQLSGGQTGKADHNQQKHLLFTMHRKSIDKGGGYKVEIANIVNAQPERLPGNIKKDFDATGGILRSDQVPRSMAASTSA